MRGLECHPWAEKISVGACEWRKFLGAIGRRLRRQGLRAGHRRRESEAGSENKSMLFTERSAAEFMSGDTEGGRPPGRRHLSTGRVQSQHSHCPPTRVQVRRCSHNQHR